MLKRILIALVVPVVLQGATTVRGWDSTSKEVVIRYTAPSASSVCTVYGSETNSFPPSAYTPIADLDTSLVANANLDTSRNALLTGTIERTLVIGKMMARKALTGYLESLALPAASTIYFQLDCEGQTTPVFATYTRTVPFGLTYGEAHPQHPDHPGQFGFPSRKWSVAGQRIIDPEYGTIVTAPLAAGDLGPQTTTYTFADATGTGWTNPKNILANDALSATIASSTNPLALTWNYSTKALGSLDMSSSESQSFDYFQLNLTGLGSAATAVDRTVSVELYVDGGVSPYGPAHDIVLGTSSGTVSYPASPVSGDHWQATGDKVIPRQFLVQRKGKVQYDHTTKILTITGGDKVGENWVAGTPVTIYQTPAQVCDATAGNPVVIRTCAANTFVTGDTVTLSNLPGTFTPPINSKWTITVVDSTHFSLNGTNATGTFGQVWHANSSSNGSIPGNPPILYMSSSNWATYSPVGLNFRFENFTDTGWTVLNGTNQPMVPHNGDTEHWEITGKNIPNSFSGAGDIIPLGTVIGGLYYPALAQVTSSYPIASITDATHVVLSSGPASDITSDADYSVDPLVIKIRKKTNTADTITIQYASMTIRTSRGTSGGAAGGSICSSKETVGPGGKKGNFCRMPGPTWVASDGSESHYIGDIPMINEEIGRGQGKVCYSSVDSGNTATFGANELHPERIYCSYFTSNYHSSPTGYDQTILRVDYEGDYTPRSSSEGRDSLYTGYAGYPFLPNCYGFNNYNDGTHARVINSGPCVSFYQVVPSVYALIENFGQQLWRRIIPDVRDLCLTSPSTTAQWNPATQTVWMTTTVKFGCTSDDSLGATWAIDIGDEAHLSTNAAVVGEFGSWERPNNRWMAIHGGVSLKTTTWASGTPQPIGWGSGNHSNMEDPSVFLRTAVGPYWFSYNAVNGTPGANITTAMGACPAGNPYLPTSAYHLPLGVTPDGATTYFTRSDWGATNKTTGCITVTIDGEPCDVSMATPEQAVYAMNPSLHNSKCGKTNSLWIDDIKPGDHIVHQNKSVADPRGWETFRVVAKSGSGPGATLTLYRGGILSWTSFNCCGYVIGAQDHTSHPHRFMTIINSTPEYGGYDDLWVDFGSAPITGGVYRAPTGGHSGSASNFSAGSSGSNYGVSTGTLAQRINKTGFDYYVGSSALTFNGVGAKDSLNVDSHVTVVEQAYANNRLPFLVDGRPWQGNGTITWTKVVGTSHVYKYPSTTFFAEKFLPSAVRNGVWVLKNVSGPSCTVSDSTPYVFGLVHVAGECVAGSQPGELYASAPVVDSLTTVYQASGNDLTATRDLAAETSTMILSRYTQTILQPDLTGRMSRAVSSLFECYRCEDSFKNWSILGNGRLMVGRSKGLEYQKSDLMTAQAPPVVLDTVDRTKWVYTTVTVPPVAGVDNVLVRFGYEHYGDPTASKFYCTPRAENCVMAAGTSSSNPYYFETTDSYSGITYAQPLSVQVPAIGNRVLHWQIVYRNGSTTVTTKYGVSVVP